MTVSATAPDGQGPIVEAARIWAEKGFSVVPIRADGTKKPSSRWKIAQETVSPAIWASRYFSNNPSEGIGIVCGKVSGNLELCELEGRATSEDSISTLYDTFELIGEDALEFFDSLWTSGYVEITPSGGLHFLYRIVDHEVPGNEKLARRPATAEELADNPMDKVKVLAETRGEGGYVIVAPTHGTVHPTGRSWEVQVGEIGVVPTITWEQRQLLHKVIRRVFDQMPKEEPREPRPTPGPVSGGTTGTRPGDDFNERADWADILEPAGWTVNARHSHGEIWWTRPGKPTRDGHSATTGHAGTGSADRLYVMSSASEFNTDEPMSKFYVYAHYNHNGDLKAATRELSRQGYGDQREGRILASPPPGMSVKYEESNVDNPEKGAAPPRALVLNRSRGRQDYTISGASVRFVDLWGSCIRYVWEQKMWRVWDGTRWIEDPNGRRVSDAFEAMTEQMYEEAQQMTAAEDPMAKAYTAYVKKLRDSGRTSVMKIIADKVTCSAEEFDVDPRYLNLQNGVYDTLECHFLAHDPKYMLTKMMNCNFFPGAKAPRAEKFLAELMPDFEQRDYVVRALGYTLTGEADQRAFFLLHGLPGTGKSQFVEMMRDLFGSYGVTAMASTFHKRPNNGQATPDLHALRGARFITTSETSQDSQLDEELIKRFTGKDRISSRSLYETPQEWVPQGTIWFATNHLPKFASDEDAVWRRVKTLPFVTQFSDDGSIGQRSEPNIGRKIAAEEADGIFQLLVHALQAYRAAGRLEEPAALKAAVAEHKRDVDPVAQFVGDSIEAGELIEAPGQQTEFNPIYQAYCTYHKENVGQYPLGRRRFADSLRSVLGYDRLAKSNGKTYLPGWIKKGWVVGGSDIGRVEREME